MSRPEPKKFTKEQRRAYWSDYRPRLVKAVDMQSFGDWRTVDLDSLSATERKMVLEVRDKAKQLGIDLADAPQNASDMYNRQDSSNNQSQDVF